MYAHGMHNLHISANTVSRSISAENKTGGKGMGAMAEAAPGSAAEALGKGWKTSPSREIQPGETYTLADIKGSGAVNHIWMTFGGNVKWRNLIIRIYWEDAEYPSVECPAGDFFFCGLNKYAPVNSLAVCVSPGKSFNCYWVMPFKKRCRITVENRAPEIADCFYQIDYSLCDIADNFMYFHSFFRRVNPLAYKEAYTILPMVEGKGKYVGTYMTWTSNTCGWWGEGEIKFYMDGDGEYPTICGTGTEDYFGGSYNFHNLETDRYEEYSTPYCGLPQIIRPDGLYESQQRFGLYRVHAADPVFFHENLRVTIQALAWGERNTYVPLRDNISSVAYWYGATPSPLPEKLANRDELEIL